MRPGARTVLVACAAALLLAGCGSGGAAPPSSAAPSTGAPTASAPRALTATEADRLAVTRFLNYQGVGRRFHTSVASSQGPLSLAGEIDYRRGIGYAEVAGAGGAFTLQWDASTLLAWPATAPGSGPGVTAEPPAALPATAPARRALKPAGSDVDAVLSLLLQLGEDRPDNAQLIAQGGARFLRAATLDGRRVDVVTGPRSRTGNAGGAVVYWIDAAGRLLRLQAHLGGGASTTTVDLDRSGFTRFPRSPEL